MEMANHKVSLTYRPPTRQWQQLRYVRHLGSTKYRGATYPPSLAVDSSKDFTITLAVVTAPFAAIQSVTAPSEASQGATISVSVLVKNTGNGTGNCHAQIVDIDYSSVVGADKYASIAPNGTYTFTWNLVMPNRDWHLRAEAWH